MASNFIYEEVWIDTWNDLYDLIAKKPELILVSFDWHQINFDQALQWIQNEAYSGFKSTWEETYFVGKPAIRLIRSEPIFKQQLDKSYGFKDL